MAAFASPWRGQACQLPRKEAIEQGRKSQVPFDLVV